MLRTSIPSAFPGARDAPSDWRSEMSEGSSRRCSEGLLKILRSLRWTSELSEEYMVRSTLLRTLVLVALRAESRPFPKYMIIRFENL